jgi:putative glycerol-1-phosphate prenyltransferase
MYKVKMKNLYQDILKAKATGTKLLAILLDPDKIQPATLPYTIQKINQSPATHIFIGGSLVLEDVIHEQIRIIKQHSNLPVIIFPGHPSQISPEADGILFLSLISGRNPDYLIGHHVEAAPILRNTDLEILPTAYILIDGGKQTAVEMVSETASLPISGIDKILHTAQAGEMLGMSLIYLEAGSGADKAVPLEVISTVSSGTSIPLICGGGITSHQQITNAYEAGADMVVIGTAFENNNSFFEQ